MIRKGFGGSPAKPKQNYWRIQICNRVHAVYLRSAIWMILAGCSSPSRGRPVLFCRRMSAQLQSGNADQLVPRPLSSQRENINPRPILRSETRQIAAKGRSEQNGVTESDRLLHAIIRLARKEQNLTTRTALRSLIVKCSREIALDF